MAHAPLGAVLQHLRCLAATHNAEHETDRALLHAFITDHDQAAFTAIVKRHGAMVLGVSRRVLHNLQDAEDAFQATFLLLARNAARIRKAESLSCWLHGVAYRMAKDARRALARRHQHEERAKAMRTHNRPKEVAWRDVQVILHEEVERLPAPYRAVFVLCCLEQKSGAEAAQALAIKEGTVKSRLSKARALLQRALTGRGVSLSAVLTAMALTAEASKAALPLSLVSSTVHAAALLAAGKPLAAGAVSANVAGLLQGAKTAMILSNVKMTSLILLALVLGGTGLHLAAAPATSSGPQSGSAATADSQSAPPAPRPKQGEAAVADAKRIAVHGRVLDPEGKPVAGARVFLSGGTRASQDPGGPESRSAADGTFRLALDRAQLSGGSALVATAAGHALAWTEADRLGVDEVVLRLAKDEPIRGRVLDLEGRPLQDVRVSVRRIATAAEGDLTPVLQSLQRDGNRDFSHPLRELRLGSPTSFLAPVQTDAMGNFCLTGLGKERVVVLWIEGPTIEHQVVYVLTRPEVNIKQLVAAAPDRLMGPGGKTSLPLLMGPVFDYTAAPTKPVVGVVRDHRTGQPLADVSIGGMGGGWWENYVQTRTDKEGRYQLLGLPKGRTLRLSAYGVNQAYLPAEQTTADSEGLGPVTVNFDLARGVQVRGRITDKATGKPVPAALWYVPLADNAYYAKTPGKEWYRSNSQGIRTEPDGSFQLLALPGSGLIKVRAELGAANPYTQVAMRPADRPKAYSLGDEGLGETFLSAGGPIETLLGHNAYEVIDPAPEAERITCDLQFDRGQTRQGRLIDPQGMPLSGVHVSGLRALGGIETLTDDTFTAVALNPAKPRLVAFVHKERKLVGQTMLGGDSTEPVTIRLHPGAAVTGRLLDEDGKPLAGVTVSASYRANQARWLADQVFADAPVKTDADGRFHVENIFPGVKFALGLRSGKGFLVLDNRDVLMTLEGGTKELGNLTAKPYRPQ